MPSVHIRHRTTYRYRNPVSFGEHRMMMRPLESYDQRVVEEALRIGPVQASLRHTHDLFGNCVGVATFNGRADHLDFESLVTLEHTPSAAFNEAHGEPEVIGPDGLFAYAPRDLPDLARWIEPQAPDGPLRAWALRFLNPVGATLASALLVSMTQAIRAEFRYANRLKGPPQTPLQTLRLRRGSCRDFAVLMIEAARSLGLAAGFVSGYVYSGSRKGGPARLGGGHTHAWVRVYLPSCGWVEFDPTNGIVGNADLIRVAVTREPRQALPLYGTWSGFAADFLGMDVQVDVDVVAHGNARPAARLRLASGA